MNDHDTHAADLVPLTPSAFRDERIAYWRREARANLALGFTDLARRCEGFAVSWEWDVAGVRP